MRGNRGTNTKPELIVRRILHALGYRYRLHAAELPGRPDIKFSRRRCVIWIHGCFWHQHSDPNCPLRSKPSSNVGYWNAKLARNDARGREQEAQLDELGWRTLTIWECETSDSGALTFKLKSFLGRRRLGPRGS